MPKQRGKLKFKKNKQPKQQASANTSDAPPSNTKAKWLSFLTGWIAFIVGVAGLCFALTRRLDIQFNADVNLGNTVAFTPTHDSTIEYTSPMCGCYASDVAHYGILMNGNSVTIDKKTKDRWYNNFLITAPQASSFQTASGFSFNARLYQVEDTLDENLDHLERLAHQANKIFVRDFNDELFLSILTNNSVHAFMYGQNQTLAYLPSFNSHCDIKVNPNKYEHIPTSVSIQDSIRGEKSAFADARIDFFGDSLLIVWKDNEESKMLFQHGRVPNFSTRSPMKKYINMLVVRSPYTTRISALSWTETYQESWLNDFYEQFAGRNLMFIADIPVMDQSDGSIYHKELKRARLPNYRQAENSKISVKVNDLLTNKQCAELYDKYTDKVNGDGSLHKDFAKGTFSINNLISPKNPDSGYAMRERKYLDLSRKRRPVDEVVKAARELQEYAQSHGIKFDSASAQKINYDTSEMGFRYPPITRDNRILIFNEFDTLSFSNAKGAINFEDKSNAIVPTNTVDIKTLKNTKFQYPTLAIPIEGSVETNLKGTASIAIDGRVINKRFYETGLFIIGSFIVSLLSFLIGFKNRIIQLSNRFLNPVKKKKKT